MRNPRDFEDIDIGDLLFRYRELYDLSQADVASRAGLSPTTVSRIESGHIPVPQMSTIRKLARVMGLTVQELLSGKGLEGEFAGPLADPPQSMDDVLEAAGVADRELAIPEENFKQLFEGLAYQETRDLARRVVQARQAINPILKRRETMPESEEKDLLDRLTMQAVVRNIYAIACHQTAVEREAELARELGDANRMEQLEKEAQQLRTVA